MELEAQEMSLLELELSSCEDMFLPVFTGL